MNRQEKRNKKKELNKLNEIITIMKQYFPELIDKFEGLTDTRNQSYVKYQMKVIFIVKNSKPAPVIQYINFEMVWGERSKILKSLKNFWKNF